MSFEVLEESLSDWICERFELDGISVDSVNSYVHPDVDISEVIRGLNQYKLGWLLLQHASEYKKFSARSDYCIQEKIFIKLLQSKFKDVLIDIDFNINTLWRKSGMRDLKLLL